MLIHLLHELLIIDIIFMVCVYIYSTYIYMFKFYMVSDLQGAKLVYVLLFIFRDQAVLG